ncbi:MAG: divergent polysaccharide deacetylase family protein [Geminicoccaceae bacterium]
MHYGAAEGVLGLTALVLVVWLLWPEDSGPKLNQRAAWQESLKKAEAERAARQAAREPLLASLSPTPTAEVAEDKNQPPREERREIAKPSELADRVRASAARWTPALRPLADPGLVNAEADAVIDALPGLGDDPSPENNRESVDVEPTEIHPVKSSDVVAKTEAAQEALDQVVTEIKLGDEPLEEEPLVEVAVLSSEALDLSAPSDPAFYDHDHSLPVESFDIKSEPIAHIRRRPRDNAPSWLKNAVSASLVDDRPVIAVVLDDLGLNRRNTAAINDLPAPLTLAFLPYAGRIEAQAKAAQQAGHELMLHLPMEPFGSSWPGPDALITSLEESEFAARLEKNLNSFDGFVGINNHMGSRLTADRGRMDLVMRELRSRDILFLDSKTSSRSVAVEMANRNGVPNTIRDVFLDHVIDGATIRRQMALVERIARQSGSAVAIGHPHNATLDALRSWLPGLAGRGFALVPISAVVARRACSDGLLITADTCGRYLLQARKPEDSKRAKDG